MKDAEVSWAEALWERYYSQKQHGAPVYLGIDDDELLEIGQRVGNFLTPKEAKASLVREVLGKIQVDQTQSLVFSRFITGARAWYEENRRKNPADVSAPPHLPFLALTVLAARNLGSEDSKGLAFYKFFIETLGLPDIYLEKVRSAYMSDIEDLWKYLNSLLVAIGGARGIPTATSITNRYVSIPMSQAVIRSRDQAKLTEFFADADLKPSSLPSDEDIEDLFDWWISGSTHSISANLEGLWKKGGASKKRVLEVIKKELDNWDGRPKSSSDSSPNRTGSIKLILRKDQDWFGNHTINTGLGFIAGTEPGVESISFHLLGEGDQKLTARRVGQSSCFELSSSSVFEIRDHLTSAFSLKLDHGQILSKELQAIYVLAFDEDAQCFLEIGKPALGQNLMILSAEANGIAARVEDVLATHAAEGAQELARDSHGFTGWRLFQNVRFTHPFTDKQTLARLSTSSMSQFELQGGLKLRESLGKLVWSRHLPPVVSASSPEGQVLRLEIWTDGAEGKGLLGKALGFGTVSIELATLKPQDGAYSAKLFVGQGEEVKATRSFSLRSESSPRPVAFKKDMQLGYLHDAISPALWWEPDELWTGFPRGPLSFKEAPLNSSIPDSPAWLEAASKTPKTKRVTASFGTKDLSSCAFTPHAWQLGECNGKQRYVDAVCTKCGSFRRELCFAYMANKEWRSSVQVDRRNPIRVEIEQTDMAPKTSPTAAWALQRALVFMQRGLYKEIREAASTLEIDAIEARNFVRSLEAAGALEIENHHREDAVWSMNPPTLLDCGGGNLSGTGAFTDQLIDRIRGVKGVTAVTASKTALGEIISVSAEPTDQLRNSLSEIGVRLISSPTKLLLGRLGPISEALVGESLDPLPEGSRVELFNVGSSNWDRVDDGRIRLSGAYRIAGSFSTSVFFVPPEGLERNRGFKTDSISAKYLAAFFAGRPLVSYAPEKKMLYVPFGMPLPGLIGRLAVSASGRKPVIAKRKLEGSGSNSASLTRYDNIELEVATSIYRALGGQ